MNRGKIRQDIFWPIRINNIGGLQPIRIQDRWTARSCGLGQPKQKTSSDKPSNKTPSFMSMLLNINKVTSLYSNLLLIRCWTCIQNKEIRERADSIVFINKVLDYWQSTLFDNRQKSVPFSWILHSIHGMIRFFESTRKNVDSGIFHLIFLNTGSGQVQALLLATWKTGAAPTASASDSGAMAAAYPSSFCTLSGSGAYLLKW
jgi:hypothetical protein